MSFHVKIALVFAPLFAFYTSALVPTNPFAHPLCKMRVINFDAEEERPGRCRTRIISARFFTTIDAFKRKGLLLLSLLLLLHWQFSFFPELLFSSYYVQTILLSTILLAANLAVSLENGFNRLSVQ